MGLFLQKLEKSLRLSTRAHVVDLPLDSGAVPPMRDQETHVAGGCGLSLSPEQQLLVDVLKQLYKIREEREKAEQHQRRSSAAASSSYGRNVVEFLDEFVKVVAVCQAVLSQRAGEAPAAAAVNRKRKLDSAEWWDQETKRKEQREDDNGDEEEEDVQIRDMLAHLRKRAKVVVGDGVCCEHREKGGLQARSERSLCCCGRPAEVVGPEQSQEALCVVTLVQQVVTTMTAAANHGRSKRGWLSAALDNEWAGGVHEKRRRTVATTDGCRPAGRKRKWAEDGEAAPSVRARDTLRRTANKKGHTNDANNNNNNNYNINSINIAAATNCNNASRQEKRKRLGITIVVTPASCD